MAASSSRQIHQKSLPAASGPAAKAKVPRFQKGQGKAPASASAPRDSKGPAARNAPHDGEELPWNWVSLTDSSASKVRPIFTKDGSYFFSIVGSSVKVHSVATGRVVSTLLAPSPENGVSSSGILTAAVLNPANEFQLITASSTGYITVWDALEASLIQIIDIEQPITHLATHHTIKDAVFVSVLKQSQKKGRADESGAVLRVSLIPTDATAQSPVQKSSEIQPVGKTRSQAAGLAFSASGSWLVAICGNTSYVAKTASLSAGFVKYVSPEHLTCLACHPSEEYFATGDDQGNIRLWYCLNEDQPVDAKDVEKKAQTTVMHWHAHAVASIAFTPNGAYLLSGGEEAVLVLWQLHTARKEFVPRVGAPISTVGVAASTSGPEEYLVGLVDGTYAFISSSTLRIVRSFSRIKLDYSSPSKSASSPPAPLAIHDTTSTLIIPSSHPSSLQIYSPSSSSLVSELEVSPSNRVSRRDDKPIEQARVDRAVISPNGQWMATIDSREGDVSFHGETHLKFWLWDTKSGHWILNTKIDRPHGSKTVNSVSFNPAGRDSASSFLVTTGEDGTIKVWRIRVVKTGANSSEECWVARSTQRFRTELPTHTSWSQDGSVLAVSSGPFVALFDPATNQLHSYVTTPGCKSACSAHFVGRGGRYLVIAGLKEIVLWDLIKQQAHWHHKCSTQIDTVVPHPRQNSFALISKNASSSDEGKTRVSIFSTSSPEPRSTHLLPFTLRNVSWSTLSSCSSSLPSAFSLIGITHTSDVVLVGNGVHPAKQDDTAGKGIPGEPSQSRRTLFQDIFGNSAFSDLTNPRPSVDLPRAKESRGGFSDEPAYLMPPLESLFNDFIGSMVKSRPVEEHSADHEGENEEMDGVDEAYDTGEPLVLGSQSSRVVDDDEMLHFVELFKKTTVDAPRPSSTRLTNKAAGTMNGKANGASHHNSRPGPTTKANGAASSTASPSSAKIASVAPSPSVSINGKKRKKSLG
ncbi:hypothetical protein HGRIS_008240 [Hohenbuehelia grisea]|uniref:WD repeat-containing protein 75 second beta-propeller domain-containing protein n=1 Tax=Hohenbuehelia grisea TaxID=104357 RepID=A0ABR3J7D8_9AGAR